MPRGMRVWSVCAALPLMALAPTPAPDLNVLGTTLVNAPDSTWHEMTPALDTLEGSFDANFYVNAEWQDQADRDAISARLQADGFIGGYGRTFHRTSPPEAWITEDVKAFPDTTHALTHWGWANSYFHDPTDTANDVQTPAIPSSFGEKYTNSTWLAIDIYFTKANYVFTITVDSRPDYPVDLAVAQATAAYNFAPSRNVLAGASRPASAHPAGLSSMLLIGGFAGAAVVIVALIAVAIVVVAYSRRSSPMPMQTVLSPDGQYWWDGTGWRPVPRT